MTLVDALQERRRGFYLKTDISLPNEVLCTLPVLNAAEAEKRCALLLPAVQNALNAPVATITPWATQGTFHLVNKAKLTDGRCLIIRSSPSHVFASDASLHIDAWTQRRLPSVGLPGLKIYHVDTSQKTLPFAWMIMDIAPGKSMITMSEDEIDQSELLQKLGNALRRIHHLEGRHYGPLDTDFLQKNDGAVGPYPQWSDYIFCQFDRHIEDAVHHGFLNREEGEQAHRFMNNQKHELMDFPQSLLHGDPGNHNFFMQNGEVTAIIDWEDALIGDPLYDVAFWATFHPRRRWDAFFAGYGLTPETKPETAVRFALYFFRITLAKILHRQRFGYTDKPGRPTSRQRLQEALILMQAANEKISSKKRVTA